MFIREIHPATEPAVFDAVVRLRLEAWTPQTPVPLTLDDVLDSFEQSARHWCGFDGEQVVAAARLSIHDRLEDVPEAECLHGVFASEPAGPIAFLSRLVVAATHRRRGLARELDEVRIRAAEQA